MKISLLQVFLIFAILLTFLQSAILLQNKSSKPSRKLKENHKKKSAPTKKTEKLSAKKMKKQLSNKHKIVDKKLSKENKAPDRVLAKKDNNSPSLHLERKLSKSKSHHKKLKTESGNLKRDPNSLKNLEKYAVTSLMTLISFKMAQLDGKLGPNGKRTVKSRKLGLMGKVVDKKSMKQSYKKLKKDLRKYLQKKKIPIKKNLKVNQMEKIVKRYVNDRFKVRGKQFEGVRSLITGFYKLTGVKLKNNV